MPKNQYLVSELLGLASFVDYTGAGDDNERVDRFYDLIAQEFTQEQRGHLDQISPAAHRQLLVEILALKDVLDGTLPSGVAAVANGDSLTISDAGSETASATATVAAGAITGIELEDTVALVADGATIALDGGPGTVTIAVVNGVPTATTTP